MAMKFFSRHPFHRFTTIRKQELTFPNHPSRTLLTHSKPGIAVPPKYTEQSLYRKQISLASLLQRYGFPPSSQLQNFFDKNRFLLNWNLVEIEKSLGILLSFKLPQKVLVSVVCDCPGMLEYDFLKKWEVGISEIGSWGASPSMIQSILECSKRFQLNPCDLSKSIRVLGGLGLSNGTIAKVLEAFPSVMTMKEGKLSCRIKFLSRIGIPMNEIDRIFFLFPELIKFGVEDGLKPLLDEFVDLDFSENLIIKEIIRDPRVLGMELGELSRCLELVRTLKCRAPIKEKILKNGAFRAGYEVKLRVDCLLQHGLTHREAFMILWKEPRAIMYGIGDIEKKIEFLVHRMKFDIDWLVEVPEYLGVNFEKQIVPRYNVIEYLRSKGGLGCAVDLKSLVRLSRLRFYNFYVKPYPGCEKLYPLAKDVELKNQHPSGLWKLFNPPKYPDSKEDVKNMKSFMEYLF